MDLKEAEELYKRYDGREFHMSREEPQLYYGAYRRLSIPEETKRKWDEELIASAFGSLWDDPHRVWAVHGNLLELLKRVPKEEYIVRLLDEMEKMTALDKRQKILITENMAGRSASLDGGCRLICRMSPYSERMDGIMSGITDFTCGKDDETDDMGWTDTAARYERAVSAYKSAYRKWNG